MTRTTVFKSNRSQAVRLPKDVAFPDSVKDVSVIRDGKRRVIVPADAVWDDFSTRPVAISAKVISRRYRSETVFDPRLPVGYQPLHPGAS